mmetsp:Transcript_151587/g.279491  ORF Transcript_151587/g.279491 Transcript_151587/m.279491 type:complete len:84 (-) Transcript_151587:79-330(-)
MAYGTGAGAGMAYGTGAAYGGMVTETVAAPAVEYVTAPTMVTETVAAPAYTTAAPAYTTAASTQAVEYVMPAATDPAYTGRVI